MYDGDRCESFLKIGAKFQSTVPWYLFCYGYACTNLMEPTREHIGNTADYELYNYLPEPKDWSQMPEDVCISALKRSQSSSRQTI